MKPINEKNRMLLKNVSKNFSTINALDNVSMDIQLGKITGLIGFNGSGKTTTLNILSTLMEKHKGRVTINNKPIINYRKEISYLSSNAKNIDYEICIKQLLYMSQLYKLSIIEAREKINKLAEDFNFARYLNWKIKQLSKGNYQKFMIIAAFLNPNLKYLLLDEPFDGLDPIMIDIIMKYLLNWINENNLILITSHRMDIINKICSAFYILDSGKVIDFWDAENVETGPISVYINKETNITEDFKNLKCIIAIKKLETEILIKIKSENDLNKLNKNLINLSNYQTIRKESAAERYIKKYR